MRKNNCFWTGAFLQITVAFSELKIVFALVDGMDYVDVLLIVGSVQKFVV